MSDWSKRNARALLRDFQAHGLAADVHLRDYHGEDLRGQIVGKDDVPAGADFSGADLREAQFADGADVSGADLSGCRLEGARLDRAILVGADLRRARLDGASLIGADLRRAALDGTTWTRARLTGARLHDPTAAEGWGVARPGAAPTLQLASTTEPIKAVDWHPAAELLAVTRGVAVEIWDVEARVHLVTLTGHTDWVWAVAWAPDGSRLASAGNDRTVRVWRVPASGPPTWMMLVPRRLRWRFAHRVSESEVTIQGRSFLTATVSPDLGGVALALGDGSVTVLPLDEQEEVRLLGLPDGGSAAFWDDGRRYRLDGDPAGRFWWSSGLCRFEPGELDGVGIERVTSAEPPARPAASP